MSYYANSSTIKAIRTLTFNAFEMVTDGFIVDPAFV